MSNFNVPELTKRNLPIEVSSACLVIEWRELPAHNWICYYYLLIPCEPGDMRDDEKFGYVVSILGETMIDSGANPYRGENNISTPFRDGVHILRDMEQLKIPGYVIFGEKAMKLELKASYPKGY